MSAALAILFWLVVALLIILVGVLVTPIRLRGYLRRSQDLTYRIEARAFGGLTPRVVLVDSTRHRKVTEKKVKLRSTKRARKSRRSRPKIGADLAPAILALFRDLVGTIHIEQVRLDAEFGLDDPADTGQLFGQLAPIQYGVPLPKQAQVSLRPNFGGACFTGEAEAVLKITAAALLAPIVRFAWQIYGPGR